MTRQGMVALAVLIALTVGGSAGGQVQAASESVRSKHFPYPKALRPQVEFWKKIFATYSRYQVVIHDTERLDRVYKVLDFRPLLSEEGMDEAAVVRIKEKETQQEMERIRALLLKLHACGEQCTDLDQEEQAIWNLYRDDSSPNKFRAAAYEDRLRSQTGLRERFSQGIQYSRRYIEEMEEIFRSEGLPVELTRLPLIESCFDLRAYSKAAAAGIWQFIPSTGRLYMRVDNHIDERRDPLIATRAAARLLKSNYELLGAWPLAVTAYNHGPNGMYKAVQETGTTDIAEIIRSYQGKAFGFASRNFYPEFLAALEVEGNHEKHFGPLQMEAPLKYDEVYLQDYVALKHLAQCADTSEEQLLFLNPALRDPIRDGRVYLPRGYRLRVPAGATPLFQERYAGLSAEVKADGQPRVYASHRVRRGQTLARIARRYGITVAALKGINGLGQTAEVRVGHVLRVPAGSIRRASPRVVASRSRSTRKAAKKAVFVVHKVRRGQTLEAIAQRYNTSVGSLKQVNSIHRRRGLQAGQVLRIPVSASKS